MTELEKNIENTIETEYWERCWKDENREDLLRYLTSYKNYKDEVIDIFKQHNVRKVCDAACGFGAYSLAFASNGFEVSGFDISPTAVEITQQGLQSCGINRADYKVASILDTGYADETFDGVIAHAVIDHLTVADAQKAIKELLRIIIANGLLLISFDTPESEDFTRSHETIEPGTMLYTEETRNGMIFHPYDWDEIARLCSEYNIIYKNLNRKNEKVIIIKKL